MQRKQCEDGGIDWSDVATSQGMPVTTKKLQEAGNRFSCRASVGIKALLTANFCPVKLILVLGPPEL